ncbi:MAG: 3-dehydroquinate synthase II [Promethearchaeota archaeon]
MKKVIFEFQGSYDLTKQLYIEAITSGFNSFLIRDPSIIPRVRQLGKVQVISRDSEEKPDLILQDENTDTINERTCMHINVTNKEDERKVVQYSEAGAGMVIIKASDWKVIPVENLIADLSKMHTLLIAEIKNLREAELFLETLEKGVDGILVKIEVKTKEDIDVDFDKWKKLLKESFNLKMETLEIVEIEEIGSGERACVDTISLLHPGEGLLVGNQARGFFLVHGEIADTEFVNARPFRVNAGAIHSYILGPDNKTNYLSELKSGSKIMIVDWTGKTRVTRVGRVKIETRPMLLIRARKEANEISAIIQNAETICLVDEFGKQVSVAKLEVGNKIVGYLSGSSGRHFGRDITESIIEK